MVFFPALTVCSLALWFAMLEGLILCLLYLLLGSNLLRGEVVDENSSAFAQGENGIALDLCVWGQHTLGQPCDDGLGESKFLELGCQLM
jgi:hypothetical protein